MPAQPPRRSLARSVIIDGSILAGGALVSYGAGLIYLPAGIIAAGLLLLLLGLAGARR
jgi:hypothetical protein